MKIVEQIIARLKEKSTWAGLGTIIALVGLKIDPEQLSAISAVVISLIGLFEIFRKESK